MPEPSWARHAETALGRLDQRFYALQATRLWDWIVFVTGFLAIVATVLLLSLGNVAAWSLGMFGIAALVLAGAQLFERATSVTAPEDVAERPDADAPSPGPRE